MEITLKRRWFSNRSTRGVLTVGDWSCYTLEDTRRPDGTKLRAQTCIPAGRYELVIDMSARFGKLIPHILGVPGFSGIRIHAGNTDADTEGCVLLGTTTGYDMVGGSRDAVAQFMPKLEEGLKDGRVFITIED